MLITKKKKKKKKREKRKSCYCNNKNNTEKFIGTYTDITGYQDISVLNICDISVLGTGHLGTRYYLGTRY